MPFLTAFFVFSFIPRSPSLLHHFFQALAHDLLERQSLHVHALERRGNVLLRVAEHRERRGGLRRLAPAAERRTAGRGRRPISCVSLAILSFNSRRMRWASFFPTPARRSAPFVAGDDRHRQMLRCADGEDGKRCLRPHAGNADEQLEAIELLLGGEAVELQKCRRPRSSRCKAV